MEAAGLALSVYKDVYLLVMSIYRLGISARHYKEEHQWHLQQFHGEYLYLREFIHVFSVLLKIEGNDQRMHILNYIYNVVEHLGKELSDYKDAALKEDREYRAQCETFFESEEISPAKLESLLIEPLSSQPLTLQPVAPSKARLHENVLGKLRTFKVALPKKSSVFTVDAWAWALFEREKLATALATFQEHNQMLRRFEFVIAGLMNSSLKEELRAAIEGISSSHLTLSQSRPSQSSFATHARLNNLIESTNYSEDPEEPINPSKPTARVQAIKAHVLLTTQQTPSQPATIKENKRYDSTSAPESGLTVAALNQLACLLWEAGTYGLHTLPLRSITNDKTQSCFVFEFGYPEGMSNNAPVSLLDLIDVEQGLSALSLPLRFHIALTISLAIGAFHADGWLHKSMRSESVCFFYDQQNTCVYRDPYIVNFEYSRPETAATILAADHDLGRNLYRHPERQGSPTVKFTKTHDLYALGVVLLEIGVWQTAESMRQDYLEENDLNDTGHVSSEIKDVFLRNAEERLGHTMGPAYKQAVKACLSGDLNGFLETNNFAVQFQEMVIENIYVERVKDIDI